MELINQYLKEQVGLILLFIALIFCSSCKKDTAATDNGLGNAHVLVVNSSGGSSAMDIYWTGNKLNTSALAYGSNTGYKNMISGNRIILIKANGTNKLLATDTIQIKRDSSYSYFVFSANNTTDAVLAEDDLSAPSAGNVKIKFANMATGILSADLVITAGPAIFTGIGFGTISSYAELKAGTYNLFLRQNGSALTALSIPNINLVSGKIYTIWSGGAVNGTGTLALSSQIFTP